MDKSKTSSDIGYARSSSEVIRIHLSLTSTAYHFLLKEAIFRKTDIRKTNILNLLHWHEDSQDIQL